MLDLTLRYAESSTVSRRLNNTARPPQKLRLNPVDQDMTIRHAARSRIRAAGIHLVFSVCVAGLAATLVFLVWYPAPFSTLSGGLNLFGLLVSVDVVLGPALTAVAASPDKSRTEFSRDLAVIVIVQLAAFGYGIHTIAMARPVYIAFEVDRFRVVSATEIDLDLMQQAPEALRTLPWLGPTVIAAVKPTDPDELLRAIELGLAGIDLSMVPSNWRDYASKSDEAWGKARPVGLLLAKYPQKAADVNEAAKAIGQASDALRFLPIISRRASWVALVAAPDAHIVGYVSVDGFF